MLEVTTVQAIEDVTTNLIIGRTVLIVGKVGIGKTEIGRQASKLYRNWLLANGLPHVQAFLTTNELPIIDLRAANLDPTDVTVPMPDAATRTVINCVPEWLPRENRDGPVGVLYLDEWTNAPIGVQAMLDRLVLEHELPNYKFPAGWRIIGTGNTKSDRAAAGAFSRASANRIAIIYLGLSVKAWLAHAKAIGVAPELTSFIGWCDQQKIGEQALHCYPANSADPVPFPTPRSITACSPYFSMGLKDSALHRQLAYNLGTDSADAIMKHLATFRLMPDLNAILTDPANAPVPREESVIYVLNVGLASMASLANIATIATYVKRLDQMYQAAFWSDAIANDQHLEATREHVQFMISQSKADIDA